MFREGGDGVGVGGVIRVTLQGGVTMIVLFYSRVHFAWAFSDNLGS